MTHLATWHIARCGWTRYFEEVAALTRGRTDVRIVCFHPGIIRLMAKKS